MDNDKKQPDRQYSMDDKTYVDYCAATLRHDAIIQQQRIMRRLAQSKARVAGQNSPASDFANRAMWQARVKLSREARMAHLTRAFLKGIPYKVVEQSTKDSTINPMRLRLLHCSIADMAIVKHNAFRKWLKGG